LFHLSSAAIEAGPTKSAYGTEEMMDVVGRWSACWGKADAIRVTRKTSSRSRVGDTVADGLTYENPT
jgi:hypothetical protein